MSDDKVDLLTQFQNLCNNLKKKRILKKPNLAEAGQQFEQLGINFEREELPQYAGLCYQSVAKCQNTLGFSSDEQFLLKSSQQFMAAHLKNLKDNTLCDDSNLHHSYMSYIECLDRLKGNKEHSKIGSDVTARSIILEMADKLSQKAGLPEQGCLEYKKALEYYSNSPIEKIHLYKKIISLKIELCDYSECLNLINCIMEEVKSFPDSGYKEDILHEAEITKILLLLILQPTPQQISRAAASALEKYAWIDTTKTNEVKDLDATLKNNGLSMLGSDLFLKLQSLVMACQYSDMECLEVIESDLMPYLKNEQKTLLQILIKEYRT